MIPELRFSVSYTTRAPRPGEVDGKDYCFVREEDFQRLIREGLLVEYVEQFGHYYGTSRTWIDQALKGNQDILFDVEIHGAKALKEHFPQGNFIFILPPSLAVLEQRLRDRGSLPETELRQRLDRVRQEVQETPWYDYLIINDDSARSHQALAGHRHRRPLPHQPSSGRPSNLCGLNCILELTESSNRELCQPKPETQSPFTLTPLAKPDKKLELIKS